MFQAQLLSFRINMISATKEIPTHLLNLNLHPLKSKSSSLTLLQTATDITGPFNNVNLQNAELTWRFFFQNLTEFRRLKKKDKTSSHRNIKPLPGLIAAMIQTLR